MQLSRVIAISSVAAALAAIPAIAAEPGEGTVSPSSPKVAWTGNVPASSPGFLLFSTAGQSPSGRCEQPYCDEFALKVQGGGNLTLQAAAENTNFIHIALEKSEDEIVEFSGTDKAKGTIKNLPAGDYPVYVYGVVGASSGTIAFDYTASAELPAAAAAPAPGGGPAPAPAPGPGAPAPGPGAPSDPATLSVKAPKASARKLNKAKSLTVKLTASKQVKNVVATLLAGRKKVGSAKLAGFAGSGSMAVRLSKKLKAGRYTLKVTATDAASGKPVATSAKLKIKR